MSGDVQPRKRKDKKRRKDEGTEQIPFPAAAPIFTNNSVNEDLNIHVHSEGGTGGGICAKLVFVVLFSLLAVIIGLIITEHRGLTDVDTVDTNSKFAQIFDGWTDSRNYRHQHDKDESIEDGHDDHEEESDNVSEEEDEHEPSEEEEDEDENENEDEELADEKSEEDEDVDSNEVDETLEDSEQADDDEDEEETQAVSEDEKDDDDDDDDVTKEEYKKPKYNIYSRYKRTVASKADDDDDNDDDDNDDDDDKEPELEELDSKEKEDDLDTADQDDDHAGNENESVEKKDVADEEQISTSTEVKQPEDNVQESSGMAVKLGVGVALLVVAHLVLVRKWRTAPDDKQSSGKVKEPTPDPKRRNTIVAPPTLQEVEPDIEQDEQDYSEEEEDSEEEEKNAPRSARDKYTELRSSYNRSVTPEGEIDSRQALSNYENELTDEEEEDEEDEDDEVAEEESENEDYDDDEEDEELLKRLEAKYGKLAREQKAYFNSRCKKIPPDERDDSDRQSDDDDDDDADYEHMNITNQEDYKIKGEIDEAHKSVQNNSAYAVKVFDNIIQKYPSSPRSLYGKALALDYLADQKKSNDILYQALDLYTKLLKLENVPNGLFKMAAGRCITRMTFVGKYRDVVSIHNLLIQRFPDEPKHYNDLAVTYLTMNRIEDARSTLHTVLSKWPNDGVALVHYGFILKITDNNFEEATKYLRRGIDTNEIGVNDGRFYFHLGDSLARLGRHQEAMKVYEEGTNKKAFLSKYQRSLYNVQRLTGKPFWDPADLPYQDLFKLLRQYWTKIRDEGLSILNENGYFKDESENLRDTGQWKQLELFQRGQKNIKNCQKCPITCSIIDKVPEARGCKRGQTKFSIIHPGTHVWSHCGPTNCRLRVHLGLKVPPKTFIRVATDTRSWREGEILVFDDSFEHEVWHNGTDFRLVLIVDVWHPELTQEERRTLSPI